MRLPWTTASIRLRLTGWQAVLTVMMIVYAGATFVPVRHEFPEQLDHHDDFETAEGLLIRTADGGIAWDGDRHHDPDNGEARVFEVWSATGEQRYRSGTPTALPPIALASMGWSQGYETVVADGERWRTLMAPITVGGHAVVLRVSRAEERVRNQVWENLVVLVLGLPLVVVLAALAGTSSPDGRSCRSINTRMGLNTWAAFIGTNDDAAIAGDVAMVASEVTSVLKALRKNGLDVVAIHHHMTQTQPTIFFLHYWGTGPADKLAAGFKEALAETGKPSGAASRR